MVAQKVFRAGAFGSALALLFVLPGCAIIGTVDFSIGYKTLVRADTGPGDTVLRVFNPGASGATAPLFPAGLWTPSDASEVFVSDGQSGSGFVPLDLNKILGRDVSARAIATDGKSFYVGGNGLFAVNPADLSFTPFSLPVTLDSNHSVQFIAPVETGTLLVGLGDYLGGSTGRLYTCRAGACGQPATGIPTGSAPWIAYGVINHGGNPGERTGDGAYVPMAL